MFNPSRDQARRFFFDTWSKYRAGAPLSALEQVALKVIGLHPEYHALLDDVDRNIDRDYTPEDGGINPFLHLSLHLAVEEQLSIDQPSGVRAQYERIAAVTGSEHDARHALLDCLGESIWQAQRAGGAPDSNAYLDCLAKTSGVRKK
jgi:hypothetical protein